MEASKALVSFSVGMVAAALLLVPAAGGGGWDAQLVQHPPSCLGPLYTVLPCLNYLRNLTVQAPSTSCCQGFTHLLAGNRSTCLCHVIVSSPNFTSLFHATINQGRVYTLPLRCGILTLAPSVLLFMTCLLSPLPHLGEPAALPLQTSLHHQGGASSSTSGGNL